MGQTAGRAVFGFPKVFDGRIHLAYPNLPEDQSIEGREEFRVLRAGHGIGGQHLASQVRALGAAKLLVTALRRAGNPPQRGVSLEADRGAGRHGKRRRGSRPPG